MIKSKFRISDDSLFGYKGRLSFIHNGREDISSAFDARQKAKINLLLPRTLAVTKATLSVYDEERVNRILSVEGVWCELKKGGDLYSFSIPTKKFIRGLYYFTIEISSIFGIYFFLRQNFLTFSNKGTLFPSIRFAMLPKAAS